MPNKKSTRSQKELEQELIRIQHSTGTMFPAFIPLHNWLRMHSRLYYNWHKMPATRGIHWGIFILYLVISATIGATLIGGLLALYIDAITKTIGH